MQVTGLHRPDCRAARLLHFAAAPLSAYLQQSRDFLLDTIHTTQKAMGSIPSPDPAAEGIEPVTPGPSRPFAAARRFCVSACADWV